MRVVLKTKNYSAIGEYSDGQITVLMGSTISKKFGEYRHGRGVKNIRDSREYVDGTGTVIKDYTFKTPSAAAQFVVGYSVNGKLVWKLENGETLKQYMEGKNNG